MRATRKLGAGATVIALVAAGGLLIDVRRESTSGFLPGSIAIPMGRSFSTWASGFSRYTRARSRTPSSITPRLRSVSVFVPVS